MAIYHTVWAHCPKDLFQSWNCYCLIILQSHNKDLELRAEPAGSKMPQSLPRMALQAVYEETWGQWSRRGVRTERQVWGKGAAFYTAGCNLSLAPAQPAKGKVLWKRQPRNYVHRPSVRELLMPNAISIRELLLAKICPPSSIFSKISCCCCSTQCFYETELLTYLLPSKGEMLS